MNYATDGKCHNAEPGTFSHECGKPATWIGTNANGFKSGFCDHCMKNGWDAKTVVKWARVEVVKRAEYADKVLDAFDRLGAEEETLRRAQRQAVEYAGRKRL